MFKMVTVRRVLKASRVSSEQPESGVFKAVKVFLEIPAFKVHLETTDLVLKESKETQVRRVPQEQTQPVHKVIRDFKVMTDLFLLLN